MNTKDFAVSHSIFSAVLSFTGHSAVVLGFIRSCGHSVAMLTLYIHVSSGQYNRHWQRHLHTPAPQFMNEGVTAALLHFICPLSIPVSFLSPGLRNALYVHVLRYRRKVIFFKTPNSFAYLGHLTFLPRPFSDAGE